MNTTKQKKIGAWAEEQAYRFLQNKGLTLLQRNYSCYSGEIDLIMQDKEDVVFVEVRLRSQIDYGSAFESVDRNKIRKLIRAAKHYLQKKQWLYKVNSRFDIVTIDPSSGKFGLEWFINAFTVDNDL